MYIYYLEREIRDETPRIRSLVPFSPVSVCISKLARLLLWCGRYLFLFIFSFNLVFVHQLQNNVYLEREIRGQNPHICS
jgi:hypothetical protein